MSRVVKLEAKSGTVNAVLFESNEMHGLLWERCTDTERAMISFAFDFAYDDCITTYYRPATGLTYTTTTSKEV